MRLHSPAAVSAALLLLLGSSPIDNLCVTQKSLPAERFRWGARSAVQLAGFGSNEATILTAPGQIIVVGKAVYGRQPEGTKMAAAMEGSTLVFTFSMGRNTDGDLWSMPYQARADGFAAGPQRVIVRHCWSSCQTITDQVVTVK